MIKYENSENPEKKESKNQIVLEVAGTAIDIYDKMISYFTTHTKRQKHYRTGYSQDIIPIYKITNGIIVTTDGEYIKILEILPINFDDKSAYKKESISNTYMSLYKGGMKNIHLKMTSDRTNPTRIIEYINDKTSHETNQKKMHRKDNIISGIKELATEKSLTKRFFIIFEYEGEEDGHKSKEFEKIYNSMYEQTAHIISSFKSTGNTVVQYEDEDMSQREILYYYFNRKSSVTESLQQRIQRLKLDRDKYNETVPPEMQRVITDCDCIAPRQLGMVHKEYHTMDCMYYTYLVIKDESYPSWAETGWMNLFTYADVLDMDVYIKKLNPDIVSTILTQITKFQTVGLMLKLSNNSGETGEEEVGRIKSNQVIKDGLKKHEDLFDFVTILTIKANTLRELKFYKSQIIKGLIEYSIFVEDTYQNCHNFLQMTMPLMYIDKKIFRTNAHNFLTSSISSTYFFTSYELFDPKGYVLGLNHDNHSIVGINHFNTTMFPNGNMTIMGTSGAGKTYTEQTMGQRMNLLSIRTHFIIPKKGYEYLKGCEAIGGVYITLSPGSKDCINIMEIRPEASIDLSVLEEGTVFESKNYLAKEIVDIMTWIQLLLGKEDLNIYEKNKMNVLLTKLYAEFGITEDDDSIYADIQNCILKKMPIIGDMFEMVEKDPELERIRLVLLPFIEGNCKNMNGQTNVDIENGYVVYNIDEDKISPDLFSSFLYIGFKTVYSIVKSNKNKYDAIFLDEIWKLLVNIQTAKQVKEMTKVIRGYAGCAILATQDISDFLDNEFGKAVLGNTPIKLFLKLLETELQRITDVITISKEDQEKILSFEIGTGLLYANQSRITIDIKSTEEELWLYNTDASKRIS